MPIITSIKPQKSKNRVNIYLDGKFGIGLDLENFVKLNLRVEQELTESDIEKIKSKADFQKSLNKALNFATYRPRSKKEIQMWLKRKKVDSAFHSRIFEKLLDLGFLDDEKFAQMWVEERVSLRPRSKKVIGYELKAKGITQEIIDKVLGDAPIDELKTAKSLVKAKAYRWEKLDPKEQKKKMAEFLARKGFSWEIVKSAINYVEDTGDI